MLVDILTETAEANQSNNTYHNPANPIKLKKGDSALFAAGFMYAYTGETNDQTDYLVSCSKKKWKLNKKLK